MEAGGVTTQYVMDGNNPSQPILAAMSPPTYTDLAR